MRLLAAVLIGGFLMRGHGLMETLLAVAAVYWVLIILV